MAQASSTLAGVLDQQARALGDRPFLHFDDHVLSFAELNRGVNRVANGLASLGVRKGVGVAIMMPNSPQWLLAYFATQKLSMIPVSGHSSGMPSP